jgi:Tfp pilus assembly protein PilX
MKNYKNNNQKGFALYLIVIMMSVLLAAVLGLSNIIVGGVNLAIIVRDSGNAFYS